jgi:hypothetical protein
MRGRNIDHGGDWCKSSETANRDMKFDCQLGEGRALASKQSTCGANLSSDRVRRRSGIHVRRDKRTFFAGVEYAHGGVSPQECILPVLDITAEAEAVPVVIKPTWQRLRLKVEVQGGAGLMFDVRMGSDISGETILPKGAPTG